MRRTIETEVGPLAVYDEGEGPPALFWHSLYVDHSSWDAVVADLVGERRCIRLDGPGHGDSPGPRRRFDLATCARAALHILDGLGVDRFDWVGNAWGGHVGVEAALSAPSRVRSLFATGAPMQALPPDLRWKSTYLLLPMLGLGLSGLAGGILAKAMLSPSAAPGHRAYVRAAVERAAKQGLVDAIRSISLDRRDLVEDLRRVACPTLFVGGVDDGMWPPAMAASQAARLPNGRFETLPAAALLAPLERPKETVALLRAFWSERPAHETHARPSAEASPMAS